MTLSVRFVASEAEIGGDLWAACFPPPLEGRWWYHALERGGLEDQFTFFYALVEEAGRPVGIAPAFLMDMDIALVLPAAVLPLFRLAGRVWPAALYQRTLFVGSPCSDEGTVGLLPGVDRRAALLVLQQAFEAECRRRRASMLVWKDVPQAGADDMAWLSGHARLFPATSFPGAEADLPGPDKAAFYAALKGSRRYSLNRKLKRSRQLADLRAEVVRQPDAALLRQIFALFWQTFERATTRFETLTPAVFEALSVLPESHFMLLRHPDDGRPVAFMLCFVQGDHVINKFIGLDYACPRDWSLYFRLWDEVVGWASGLGARVIQSGQTSYRAKVDMGHRLVPLTNYCRHVNPLIHWVYGKVAASIGWASLDEDLATYLKTYKMEDLVEPLS